MYIRNSFEYDERSIYYSNRSTIFNTMTWYIREREQKLVHKTVFLSNFWLEERMKCREFEGNLLWTDIWLLAKVRIQVPRGFEREGNDSVVEYEIRTNPETNKDNDLRPSQSLRGSCLKFRSGSFKYEQKRVGNFDANQDET